MNYSVTINGSVEDRNDTTEVVEKLKECMAVLPGVTYAAYGDAVQSVNLLEEGEV
jgi:hypothetical protein